MATFREMCAQIDRLTSYRKDYELKIAELEAQVVDLARSLQEANDQLHIAKDKLEHCREMYRRDA